MFQAVVVKELRETIGIALGALVAYAYLVANGMGVNLLPYLNFFYVDERAIPFVGGLFPGAFVLVSGAFAMALGLRQSAWESARGTFLFLLHRPVSWGWLLGAKLLVGAAVYLLLAALPILLYGWWAATPGTHASPFFWSMTLPCWQIWVSMTAVYLGAFLSGMRPARWIGSRLLPLAAMGLLVYCIQLLPGWWVWGLAAVALLNGLVTANIFFVARNRDFA